MDEAAIGKAVDAMYAMISGPAGPRDWSTQEAVFHADCRQIRTGVDADGTPWRLSFSLAEYRDNADALLANVDFFEKLGSPGGASKVGKTDFDAAFIKALPPMGEED